MKLRYTLLTLALATSATFASHHAIHWGYTGHGGPEHWGKLSDDFKICMIGKNQSPIDLQTASMFEAKLPAIEFSYHTKTENVVDNGHTVQVNLDHGSYIVVDGKQFMLKQFHFHSPSENRIDGKSFPLEAHFVHADRDGNLAVVALMFQYGTPNPVIEKIFATMPHQAGKKHALTMTAEQVDALLPKKRDYYRFNGSLTTPPCSEGVRWLVLKQPVTISKEQVKQFTQVMGDPNNRPVQPLNARVILK